MATNYTEHFSTKQTSQREPIPGRESEMVANRAGGFTFSVGKWGQLERFLVLGAEGGTYYAGEKEMTIENARNVQACIKEDGVRVVDTIVAFDRENRAPKANPLLFALAICSKTGDEVTRTAANKAVSKVCGTPTQLFMWMGYAKALGGWGSGTRRAIARWYNEREPERLAFQMAKYASREGWTHKDALRVSHAVPVDAAHNDLFAYAVNDEAKADARKKHMKILAGAERIREAGTPKEAIALIEKFRLPWECVPTQFRKDAAVNEVLLQKMAMTATIRQLGRLTAVGLLGPMSDSAKLVIDRIADKEALHKARVHPIQVLAALSTYKEGHGARGNLSWTPNQQVIDALDEAFYLSFHTVEPTGKRFYLGLDVSGSMSWSDIAGIPGLTPRVGSAAMAMVTARTEDNYYIAGFSDDMQRLDISPRQRLDTVLRKVDDCPMGRTDCSLPMRDALKQKIEVDVFVIYTDSETWAGVIHPVQALKKYRDKMGIPAKLVVVGMTATEFTIADPNDPGTLDIVGFDSAAPKIMADFAR